MTRDEFICAVKKLGIDCSSKELDLLERYYSLLIEWNSKINLTSITLKEDVYLKHFYDSLTISRVIDLNGISSLCDVGSGAGFPGIVLKIFFPNLRVTLVDSLEKRVKFLNLVIDDLNLKDIYAIHDRCEVYSRNNINKFDLVVSRAVGKSNILLEMCAPMVKVNGMIILYKGHDENISLSNALDKLGFSIINKFLFKLPNGDDRMFLIFKKIRNTSNKYPRRFSEIKKRPL